MESSQERSTASTEAAQEGGITPTRLNILKNRCSLAPAETSGHAKIQPHLELIIISFLATPFMQRLMLSIEPVLMLAMALFFM